MSEAGEAGDRHAGVVRANKVRIGFFSFTEITDPAEHRSYNEWHMLDHMPEQYPLDGVAFGQRWVSTPACRAVRVVSDLPLDPVHYVTLYLMTEPVERTLREFAQLGRELREKDRFHLHRRARMSGPFRLRASAVARRVLVSEEAVPYRPNRGVYVVVEAIGAAGAAGAGGPALHTACCEVAGVAGAWSFADEAHRITVAWLDAPPLEADDGLAAIVRRRVGEGARVVFAGPFESITPWQWDWFDGG